METSELIKQVKLRPVIWNTTHKDHNKMAVAWKQICKMAWPDFNTRSPDEKRTKCLDLQKKWNKLCQSFTRDHLRQKQRKERGVQKSQYYEQLSFLIPTLDKKIVTVSSNGPESNDPSTSEASTLDETSLQTGPSTSTTSATPSSYDRDAEEDRQFLLSLVSFMQDVPRSSKLALRADILQLIAKYTEDSLPNRALAFSQEY